MTLPLLLQLLGTWTAADGVERTVPCPAPSAYEDERSTLRLPAGCAVHRQRIAYPLEVDLELRAELPRLRQEVIDSRAATDKVLAEAKASQEALQADYLKALAQNSRAQVEVAAAQRDNYLFLTIGVVLGILGGALLTR